MASTLMAQECPICFERTMTAVDEMHPLQCKQHCGFNCCKRCISSLIDSSKDDYMEASDGNFHVKVFLNCPNCRSDLSSTLHGTLILRKADSVLLLDGKEEKAEEKQHEEAVAMSATDISGASSPDDLNTSRHRLKQALQTSPQVHKAINDFRKVEAKYLGEEIIDEENEHEEEGVEADLNFGVHTVQTHNHYVSYTNKKDSSSSVDLALMGDMDGFLSDEEKRYVTELMTSGDTQSLVEGSNLLIEAMNLAKEEGGSRRKRRLSLRSSIFELIDECQEARKTAENRDSSLGSPNRNTKTNQQVPKHVGFQQLYPLPVRMPKCILLDLRSEPLDMQFVDHEWDGTVRDAYSKINISREAWIAGGTVISQKRNSSPGVSRVLGCENNHDDVVMDLPNQPRVVLSFPGQAGNQGARKGDVITHVNGTPVHCVSQLWTLLRAAKATNTVTGSIATLTLNAEEPIAAALARRAETIDSAWKHYM